MNANMCTVTVTVTQLQDIKFTVYSERVHNILIQGELKQTLLFKSPQGCIQALGL